MTVEPAFVRLKFGEVFYYTKNTCSPCWFKFRFNDTFQK